MSADPQLQRSLGLIDAVVIGLGSMIGAGVFVAFGPAARAAGAGIVLSLLLAGMVAYANAMSSARLAACYPSSGGTYVYGRERLGPFWGYLAGWGFVVGKTASCAAMALTIGTYLLPSQPHAGAVAAVGAVAALTWFGISRSALATRVIVAVVLAVLIGFVGLALAGPAALPVMAPTPATPAGIFQGAGLLFFAFAGYARIATLGEEVRDPARTIPLAIPIALGITLAIYGLVAWALLHALGSSGIALAAAPLSAAAAAAGTPWLVPVVAATAGVAALGSLLALLLGVSRTTLAMARDGHLPRLFARVDAKHGVPNRGQLAIAALVAVVAAFADIRGAIGFSSFGVLAYYAIANASAWHLNNEIRRSPLLPGFGLAGCVLLALTLPWQSVAAGAGVLALGAALYAWRRNRAA